MLQKTFGIYGNRDATGHLCIEAGTDHLACWTASGKGAAIQSFELFQYQQQDGEQTDAEEWLRLIKLNSVLIDQHYEAVSITWENEWCIFVPPALYEEGMDADYLTQVTGETFQHSKPLHENTGDVVLVYKTQQDWFALLQQQFPAAVHSHKYAQMLKDRQGETNGRVQLIFYTGHFLLLLEKHQQLQLIQRFAYRAVSEVIYHLLNVCERTGTAINETAVQVSGLIDLQSPLYAELHKYIRSIYLQPAGTVEVNDALNAYPQHYFTPFFKHVI